MRQLSGRLDLCSINTATIGYRAPIVATVDAIARAGFGAISPWRREIDESDARTVARRIRDAELKVSSYCRSSYLPACARERFLGNIDDNRRAIDQAAVLEAEAFVMVVGSLPAGSRDLSAVRVQVEDGLALLLGHARSAGVKLSLEPLHPMYADDRSCVNTLEQALDIAARIEPSVEETPFLGIAVDVYHVWWDPKLAGQIARAGAQRRLFALHLCDWLTPTKDLLLDRGMMGDGSIDIPFIRQTMEDNGFAGHLEVEIFSRSDWWLRPIDEVLAICAERLQTVC